jgi:hypothetical protein
MSTAPHLQHRPLPAHTRRPRWPTELRETPLFGRTKPLPRARLAVGGWRAGDLCVYHDVKIPGSRLRARVIAALPRLHEVVIRIEGRDALVTLNPILDPRRLSRPGETTVVTP